MSVDDDAAARLRDLWARLAESGTVPTDLELASHSLPNYSVAVEPWMDRLAKRYLQDLCRRNAHFKLVIAPYGGGKTHFLIELGNRARKEDFAVSYVPCSADTNLEDGLELYKESVKKLWLPGETESGLRRFLGATIERKRAQISSREVPDEALAFERWLHTVERTQYEENAFGRVMAAALRGEDEPSQLGEAAFRWLQGDPDTLGRSELEGLGLARISAKDKKKFGRNMLLSMAKFLPEAGPYGWVLLIDEVETLFTARGKSLLRVLAAMRILVDIQGVPLLGTFAAVPDIMEQIRLYEALRGRLSVIGAAFDQGNDLAVQLHLDKMDKQEKLLADIGRKLIQVGSQAKGVSFDAELQSSNAENLAQVAAERNLDVDARRLYVKTWVSLLEEQSEREQRRFENQELSERYQGAFDSLRASESDDFEP